MLPNHRDRADRNTSVAALPPVFRPLIPGPLGGMTQGPLLEFNSSLFVQVPGEDEATNPGIYGKALAHWLAQRLRSAGIEVEDVFPEDFGWCISISSKAHSLYVTCASTGEQEDQWRVFAFAEGGVVARLLRKDRRAASVAELHSVLRRCLESEPGVTQFQEIAVCFDRLAVVRAKVGPR